MGCKAACAHAQVRAVARVHVKRILKCVCDVHFRTSFPVLEHPFPVLECPLRTTYSSLEIENPKNC
jgi:hypothetical protein